MINKLLSNKKAINGIVTSFIKDTIDFYHTSDVRKKQVQRMAKMDDSIDLRFSVLGRNRVEQAWMSNVVMPLVREAYISRRASLSAAFDRSKLVNLRPGPGGVYQRAKNMENVLHSVLENMQYHMNVLEKAILVASRYGTCPVVSHFHVRDNIVTKTEAIYQGGQLVDIAPVRMRSAEKGVRCSVLNPKNYGQHPGIADYKLSPYNYYHSNPFIYEIINDTKKYPDFYLKENVLKLIKKAKDEELHSEYYHHDNSDKGGADVTVKTAPITHWYGKLLCKGNQDDQKEYYVQFSTNINKVIGIGINDNDYGARPIDIFNVEDRHDRHCGSSDAEGQVPMENALKLMLNIYTDSALQQLRSFVMYDNSNHSFSTADINEASSNNGFLGIDLRGNRRLGDVIQQVQFGGVNTHALETAMAQVKESSQRTKSTGDFVRSPTQGGLQNKTAEASRIIANQANTSESYYLRTFSYGFIRQMTTVTRMLQQRLGRYIQIQGENKSPIVLAKEAILGEMIPYAAMNLSNDQIERSQRLHNFISAVQNFKVTGDPSWERFKLAPVIREWSETNLANSNVDIDQAYPEVSPEEQQQMDQQQLMQQQQQQAAMQEVGV